MNEAQTRLELIDPQLREAGWGVVAGSRIRVEFSITQGKLTGHGKRTKPLTADYVLEYQNRRLAVVEAKKRDKHYTEGVGQAKDYARRLAIRFTYATNGLKIYGIDREKGIEGDVEKFPTPDELWAMTFGEATATELSPNASTPNAPQTLVPIVSDELAWRKRFDDVPFERFKGKYEPRYYQYNAIMATLDAIAEGKKRILLTMATGTGKTATAFHICWKLFHAKWNLQRDASRAPRILFLADRNVLANQAFNSFGDFEKIDENILVRITPAEVRKKGKVPTNGSIFFTIFQSFMSGQSEASDEDLEQAQEWRLDQRLPDDAPTKNDIQKGIFGQYDKDFFDFIIIDECHRGGANDESSWRAIMEYFSDAVQLGLTATPKRETNADTYDYFGEPVYTYSLKDGINDGFLTPFRVMQIDTTLDNYTFTEGDKVIAGEVDKDREYTEQDFNSIIKIKAREAYRVKQFLSLINPSQRTLVFCKTQVHALEIRDLINQYSVSNNPDYCHRVTAEDGKLGERYLDDFQDDEKSNPVILTTSQKLSTGVDAPQIRHIVLLRPVNSMVEFKQIVGRGTRLAEGKDYFTIFDFVGAHQHFKDPDWDGDPEPPDLLPTERPEIGSDGNNDDDNVGDDDTGGTEIVEIELSPLRVLQIDSMIQTTFFDADGRPIGAERFIKNLYGEIPTLFEDEATLRNIWAKPSTRKQLLEQLAGKGFTIAQLEDLRRLIKADDCDLFDVLTFVAYERDVVTRRERANRAKAYLEQYDDAQKAFIDFVLTQYMETGITELDDEKLPEIITLKYGSLVDAKSKLGEVQHIRELFIDFQEHLYLDVA